MPERFTETLRAASEAGWSHAVQHRFVNELFAGAVPDAVMARYLIQDHRFLDSFLVLLGAALASADTFRGQDALWSVHGFCDMIALAPSFANSWNSRSAPGYNVPGSSGFGLLGEISGAAGGDAKIWCGYRKPRAILGNFAGRDTKKLSASVSDVRPLAKFV